MAVWVTEWAAAAWVKLRHSARVMKYSIFLFRIVASPPKDEKTVIHTMIVPYFLENVK